VLQLVQLVNELQVEQLLAHALQVAMPKTSSG
jgi:hypothetical protein